MLVIHLQIDATRDICCNKYDFIYPLSTHIYFIHYFHYQSKGVIKWRGRQRVNKLKLLHQIIGRTRVTCVFNRNFEKSAESNRRLSNAFIYPIFVQYVKKWNRRSSNAFVYPDAIWANFDFCIYSLNCTNSTENKKNYITNPNFSKPFLMMIIFFDDLFLKGKDLKRSENSIFVDIQKHRQKPLLSTTKWKHCQIRRMRSVFTYVNSNRKIQMDNRHLMCNNKQTCSMNLFFLLLSFRDLKHHF